MLPIVNFLYGRLYLTYFMFYHICLTCVYVYICKDVLEGRMVD